MCGILFILDKSQNNQADQSQAEAALDVMAARGPDARTGPGRTALRARGWRAGS